MKLFKSIRNILEIASYEMNEVFHDHGILLFILFVPLAYPLLYSYVYTNEVVRDVPCVVVDDSHSMLSREFVRKVDACPEVEIVGQCCNMHEAQELLKERKAYGIIHIPSSLNRDLFLNEQSHIGVYCDMSSMLYYKGIVLATNNVALDMNRDIKVERYLPSTTDRQEEIARMPIEYEYVTLFNPQSGFAAFLIPPVLMLIIQQTLLLGVGMSMGRARENYLRNWRALRRLYRKPHHIVAGKSVIYLLIYMIMSIYMFGIVTRSFGLPSLGNYWTFLIVIIPYILSCIFLAIILSVLVYRREDCIMLFVSLSVPLLFMSGLTWPVSAMPAIWKYVSYIFPSTFGMNAYVRIASMGCSLSEVRFDFSALWIQCGVYFLIACMMYRWRINSIKRRLVPASIHRKFRWTLKLKRN